MECAGCGLVFAKWKAKAEGAAPSAAARPSESGSRGGFWVLLVAVAVGAGVWRSSSSGAGAQDASGRLDPTPYRRVIVDLESVLYKDEPVTAAVGERIEVRSRQLSGQVSSAGTDLSRQAGDWLQSFATAVATDAQGAHFTPATRTEWIRRWEQLRADAFMQTGWFHEATVFDGKAPVLEPAQAAQRLQGVCQALSDLQEAAVQETDVIKAAEEKDRAAKWRAWAKDWKPRLERVTKDLPADKTIPAGLWDAQQALRSAAGELRDVPQPDSEDPWLSNAKDWLQKARSMLERETSRTDQ